MRIRSQKVDAALDSMSEILNASIDYEVDSDIGMEEEEEEVVKRTFSCVYCHMIHPSRTTLTSHMEVCRSRPKNTGRGESHK